ncbi:MAG: HNH endonuclease [Bradyrhizobium sp.]|nr:HNH endonuclease [Bradyrhizobium sp.]
MNYNDKRWKAVRFAAKRRDGWQCTKCGSPANLEVHHLIRARQEPALAFSMGNVVTLCRTCHITETLAERGQLPSPARQAWIDLLKGDTACLPQ